MSRTVLCCALVLSTFLSDGRAQEPKKGETEGRNKLEATQPASAINFAKELAVPLDCLANLGGCIEQARRTSDPVELACLAQKLAVAEKVAGKKAALTSDALMKEAVALALSREFEAELRALAVLTSDEKARTQLTAGADDAKKRDDENAAAVRRGERPKELYGPLHVTNHSGECLRIYVCGRYIGEVHAGQCATFRVHDHSHVTHLTAVCEGGHLISRRSLHGHFHHYDWHIDR